MSASAPRTLPVLLLVAGFAPAQTASTFPEAQHAGGELRHVQGVPVLTVGGTPEQIGEQFGTLAVKNAPDLDGLYRRFLTDMKMDKAEFLLKLMARRLEPGIPPDHLTELRAAARAADRDLGLLLFANCAYDLDAGLGCSAVVIEADRSRAGEPLLGRNFDWIPTKGIPEHTLIAVFRPAGKRAFAAVTIAPILGCVSGMNDAGLCCVLNQVYLKQATDGSAFDWQGTPTMLAFRRVLEECATVAEAEALLRGMRRTTAACLTVCDPAGGAVFEITPKSVAIRRAKRGITACTNHFGTPELCREPGECRRFARLERLRDGNAKLGVAEVFAELDAVNQGNSTLQAMVFEPAAKVLHLKLGDGIVPATKANTARFELGKLLSDEPRP